jgi:hypothetical protein
MPADKSGKGYIAKRKGVVVINGKKSTGRGVAESAKIEVTIANAVVAATV